MANIIRQPNWSFPERLITPEIVFHHQHFERVGDFAADAFAFAGATTDAVFRVRGQIMTQVFNGRGIVHSGAGVVASCRFAGLLIDTNGTTAAGNRPVEISAAGLVLEHAN